MLSLQKRMMSFATVSLTWIMVLYVLRKYLLRNPAGYLSPSAAVANISAPSNTGDIHVSSNNTDSPVQLSEYCQTDGSLHQIAQQMANFSSPPGSKSFRKTLRVLQASPYFHVYLPHHGIFVNVAENLGAMMEGFGLKPWASRTQQKKKTTSSTKSKDSFLLMEISYYARNAGPNDICHNSGANNMSMDINCSSIRIVIQSEQLQQVGEDYFLYLKACHELPLCVIWDFSDYHFQWAQQHNISDSVMLLPVMHQSLLGAYDKDPLQATPLANRSLDVVFFGAMKERRKTILQEAQNLNNNSSNNLQLRFDYSTDLPYIKESYANAKVCLIVHSYSSQSAGEYHRLHELAPSGCVPVVEQFADILAVDIYHACGGVIFAPYNSIVAGTQQVLEEINNSSSNYGKRQELHLLWWNRRIRWPHVLIDIFGDQTGAQ